MIVNAKKIHMGKSLMGKSLTVVLLLAFGRNIILIDVTKVKRLVLCMASFIMLNLKITNYFVSIYAKILIELKLKVNEGLYTFTTYLYHYLNYRYKKNNFSPYGHFSK